MKALRRKGAWQGVLGTSQTVLHNSNKEIEKMFVTAYQQKGQTEGWLGDDCMETLSQAEDRLAVLRLYGYVERVAAFSAHHWNYGAPTCKPALFIDKRDK